MKNQSARSRYLFQCLLALLTPAIALAAPQTFMVTNSNCKGSGSIVEAVDLANANPGIDTIKISDGLTLDMSHASCFPIPSDPGETRYPLTFRESAILDGNRRKITGSNLYISSSGNVNAFSTSGCPSKSNDIFGGIGTGFIRVGDLNSGGSGVNVIVQDLYIERMTGLANVRENASLTLKKVVAKDIRDIVDCTTPAINVAEGGNLSLDFFRMRGSRNWAPGFPTEAIIQGGGSNPAGLLTIKDAIFGDNDFGRTIAWKGDAEIENLWSDRSGGMFFQDGTAQIVNSLIGEQALKAWTSEDWIISHQADVTFRSATLHMGPPPSCDNSKPFSTDGCTRQVIMDVAAPFQAYGAGASINFIDSAIQVSYLEPLSATPHPINLLDVANGGVITANDNTFIQPIPAQDASALKALTGQPNLLTDAPALPSDTVPTNIFVNFPMNVSPLVGTNTNPGILIDRISDAECGESNQLLSPIDSSCITEDVFGSPRTDGNGRRNVGAVQSILASHLLVTDVQKTTIDLSWSQSGNLLATGYSIFCKLVQSSKFTRCLNVSGASTTTATLTGLGPDSMYEFYIVGVDATGDGPTSNLAVGTTLPDPHLDYPNGKGKVGKAITSLQPHTHDIASPAVYAVGNGTLIDGLALDSNTGIISGTPTVAGVSVVTITVNGVGGHHASTDVTIEVSEDTKQVSPYLDYPDGRGEVGQEIVPLYPHVHNFKGAVTYAITSGRLPAGLKFNKSTGVISGTPKKDGSFQLAVLATGSNGKDTVKFQIVILPSAQQPHSTPAEAENQCEVENLLVPDVSHCRQRKPKVRRRKKQVFVRENRSLLGGNRDYVDFAIPIKQEGVEDNRKRRRQLLRGPFDTRRADFRRLKPGCWAFQYKVKRKSERFRECSKLRFMMID